MNYKITSAEVKTVYHITIGTNEMLAILDEAKKIDKGLLEAVNAFQLPNFENFDVGRGTARTLLEDLWRVNNTKAETDTIRFIAREILDFDGIDNFGFFDKNSQCTRLTVYKYGDRMN